MESNIFSELVKLHFNFLIDDFGFSVVDDIYFPDMMGNAAMIFESPQIGIRIHIRSSTSID